MYALFTIFLLAFVHNRVKPLRSLAALLVPALLVRESKRLLLALPATPHS